MLQTSPSPGVVVSKLQDAVLPGRTAYRTSKMPPRRIDQVFSIFEPSSWSLKTSIRGFKTLFRGFETVIRRGVSRALGQGKQPLSSPASSGGQHRPPGSCGKQGGWSVRITTTLSGPRLPGQGTERKKGRALHEHPAVPFEVFGAIAGGGWARFQRGPQFIAREPGCYCSRYPARSSTSHPADGARAGCTWSRH